MKTLLLALALAVTAPPDAKLDIKPKPAATKAIRPPKLIAQAAGRPAAAGTLEIVAPTRVPFATGFTLQAKTDGVSGLSWAVLPATFMPYLVQIQGQDGEVNPAIFIYGQKGTYNFICTGVAAGAKPRAVIAVHTVTVGDGPAPPGPGPDPDPDPPGPDPDPPVPPDVDKFGLADSVKAWALGVSDANKAANALVFAKMCDSLVGQIGGRGGMTLADALAAFDVEFKKIPLGTKVLWRSALYSLRDRLNTLRADGSIKTAKDVAQALQELSHGLKQVR